MIEVLKQALEALEHEAEIGNDDAYKKERDALRQAIAEAEKQEPVAWRGYNWSHSPDDWVYRDFDDPILDGNGNNVGQPLYTSPPQRQPLTDERVLECAKRLVEYADFRLGGVLSADSKAKDIPSKAVSQVKARHLAALRDALTAHGIKGEA